MVNQWALWAFLRYGTTNTNLPRSFNCFSRFSTAFNCFQLLSEMLSSPVSSSNELLCAISLRLCWVYNLTSSGRSDVSCCCCNEIFFGTMEWSEDRLHTFVLEYWRASQQSRPWWRSSGSVASMLDLQRRWATGTGFVVWCCKEIDI